MKKVLITFLVAAVFLIASTTVVWGAVQGEAQLEQQMLTLINAERAKEGLKPLQMDQRLVELARMKSQDMIEKNYFSHTSPTYGDPFQMMQDYGIQYWMAGENLAGNPSLTGAHQALMNSPGHRANILKSEFSHVGIGVVRGGPYGMMITQMFIKARGEVTTTVDEKIENTESTVESKDLKVFLQGREIKFPDAKPYININKRIMVPVRFVSQEMNYQVGWQGAEQKIIIQKDDNQTIYLWVGKKVMQKDNQLLISDTTPELVNNRTMIPLRMVSELLGSKVIWQPQLYQVQIDG